MRVPLQDSIGTILRNSHIHMPPPLTTAKYFSLGAFKIGGVVGAGEWLAPAPAHGFGKHSVARSHPYKIIASMSHERMVG